MRWLVATDVAARGIDIKNVELIIQTEPPRDADTYIHRSGRTARAGKFGTCITMFTSRSQSNIEEIQSSAGVEFTQIQVPTEEDL